MAGGARSGVIDYRAQASACRTQNQFNRLHIEFERILAPAEVVRIAIDAGDPGFPEPGRVWLASLEDRTPDLFSAPEPFARHALGERIMLYRADPEPRSAKRLLVGFTGIARRMMVQTPAFLQALDAREWDVAIVRRTQSYFAPGEGAPTDVEAVLRVLEANLAIPGYRGVTMLGTSGGGGAAIVAALAWGAARGVSICGAPGAEMLQAYRTPRGRFAAGRRETSFCFVYGDGFEPDRAAAHEMQAALGGELRAVPDAACHNILDPVQRRGELRSLFEQIL